MQRRKMYFALDSSVQFWIILASIMEVFAVTVFVSLLFGILFAVLFVAERLTRSTRSLEQEALLPLDDSGIVHPEPVTPKSSH